MTSNPRWMQRAELVLAGEDVDEQVARVSVWDKRTSNRKSGENVKPMTCLGAAVFPLARLEAFRPTALDLALEGGTRDGARVAIVLELRDAGRETRRAREKTKRAEATRARRASAATPTPITPITHTRARPGEADAFARAPENFREISGTNVVSLTAITANDERHTSRAEEETARAPAKKKKETNQPTPREETRERMRSARAFLREKNAAPAPLKDGERDVSASNRRGSDSNHTSRGDDTSRGGSHADSPHASSSPASAPRRRAPEVSFFGMTTPPPRVSRTSASPAARFANERVTVSAAPEPLRGERSIKPIGRDRSPGPITTGNPITPVVGSEAVASDVVPTTTGVFRGKAEDARVDSAEAETQTEETSRREEKNVFHDPSADPSRTPLVGIARDVDETPFVSRNEPDDFGPTDCASPGAPPRPELASYGERSAALVPPSRRASPFGSGPNTHRGSPARPPLRPRLDRPSPEREGSLLRPRRSPRIPRSPAGKENGRGAKDAFAATKKNVEKKTSRRAFPPDDAAVAAATTRAVVAVELDEAWRLGRRLARAEAALDAF